MKILKTLLALLFTFNVAFAKDTKEVLAIPYHFVAGSYTEETEANFLVYADKFKNLPSLVEGIETIFSSATDADALKSFISNPADLSLAQKFLREAGEFSPEKFSYAIYDGDNILALLGNKFILIDKDGKWDVSKKSALYKYIAKTAKSAKVDKEHFKHSDEIEFLCAGGTLLETRLDEQVLEVHEVFFYYTELFDAFFALNLQKFTDFLDENSKEIFTSKIDNVSNIEEISKILADDLKEERVYRNIAQLGDTYIIIFESHKGTDVELTFGTLRDISCGIEIMNYANPDPVLLELISRQK